MLKIVAISRMSLKYEGNSVYLGNSTFVMDLNNLYCCHFCFPLVLVVSLVDSLPEVAACTTSFHQWGGPDSTPSVHSSLRSIDMRTNTSSTRSSQAVSHPSTVLSQFYLTSEFRGSGYHRVSIHASHPAAPGSNPVSTQPHLVEVM